MTLEVALLLAAGAPHMVPAPPLPKIAKPPREEPCLIIKDTPEIARSAYLPTSEQVTGHYRCSYGEAGYDLGMEVRLAADGTFEARQWGTDETAEAESGNLPVRLVKFAGRWQLDGDSVSLLDDTVAPNVEVEPLGSDARLRYSIEVVTPTGKPVSSLLAMEPRSSGVVAFDGLLSEPSDYPTPPVVWLAQEGDAGGGFVVAIRLAPGGPNRFRVTYDANQPHPRNLRLQIAGRQNQVLVLPAGLGAMVLRRVP